MHFDPSWQIWLLLIVAAIAGGAQNAAAGGGSFWSFPALVYAGVPSVIANASNTVALNPALFVSAWAYREDLKSLGARIDLRWMIASGMAGGAVGAVLLIATPQHTFDFLIPWLLLVATLLFAFGRQLAVASRRLGRIGPRTLFAVQFAIAIYGGYFGGGVGFLMLALYGLFGLDNLHEINALKTVMSGVINAAALVIFIVSGDIVWAPTLVMMAAAMLGGYYGAKLTKRAPPGVLRLVIIAIGTLMTVSFFIRQYG
jgi:uncharacterized membrane protein YfcA